MLKAKLITLLLSLVALISTAQNQLFNDEVYKLSKVLGYIDAFYVDTVNKN